MWVLFRILFSSRPSKTLGGVVLRQTSVKGFRDNPVLNEPHSRWHLYTICFIQVIPVIQEVPSVDRGVIGYVLIRECLGAAYLTTSC